MDGTLNGISIRDAQRGQITQKGNKLEAPPSIIPTPSAALALYNQVRLQNLDRIALWAAIEGLCAGNPPYDQTELDTHGLGYMTNYNDLSAMSRFEKEALAYWNLLNNAERLVQFSLDYDEPDATTWAQTLSIEFNKAIRKWRNLSTMLGTHTSQLSKLGLSCLLWHDERDWRPRVVELHRLSLPDQAVCDMDQLTYVFVENDYTAQYLFECYKKLEEKYGESLDLDTDDYTYFWNPKALRDLLLERANTNIKAQQGQVLDMYELQSRLQNGDATYGQLFGDGIRLVSCLYKEYSGKVSHYMFDPIYTVSGFAYKSLDQYKEFSQVVQIFTKSPAEFTLHSNKGVGHKVFAPCQAKNQLACGAVDMARYSSTPMFRNQAGAVKDPQQIKMFPGVPTDIGASEFVQNNLGNNLPQVVGVLNYIDQNLSFNLGMSGDDPAVPDSSNASVSPTQARLDSYREFNVLKNMVAHFYVQMDYVYQNIVSIMLKSKEGYPGYEIVKKWREACKRKGVPDFVFDLPDGQDLPDQMDVRATRVAGDGSTVGLMLGLQEMAPILGDLSPRAARAYKRDMVLAALGADAIPRYMQDSDEPDEVSGGASLAGTENAVMQMGYQPVFSPSNEHKAHVAVHLALGVDTMQRVQQQEISPVEAQRIFNPLIPHLGEHWGFIVKSPFGQAFVERYKQGYDQVVQYAILNKKNAIKMAQAEVERRQKQAEQQEEVLNDQQLKELQVTSDIARKERESQAKLARNDRESEVRGEKMLRDSEAKHVNDRLNLAYDYDIKSQEVAQKGSIEQAKAAVEALTKVQLPNGGEGK